MKNRLRGQIACRICATVHHKMIGIFEEHDNLICNICSMLSLCGDLTVDRNDGYSDVLCQRCTAQLLVAYNFRQKCIQIQKTVRQTSQVLTTFNNDIDDSESCLNIDQLLRLIVDSKVDPNHLESPVESHDFNESKEVSECLISNDAAEMVSNNGYCINVESVNSSHDNIETHSDANDVSRTHFDSNCIILYDPDGTVEPLSDTAENEQQLLTIENEDDGDEIIQPTQYTAISYLCDDCGAYFMQSVTLLSHLLNVHNPKNYFSCTKCKHCFINSSNYQTHIAECQFDIAELNKEQKKRNDLCKYCEKKFNGKYALEMHVRTHTGEKPFQCTSCDKTFRTAGALTSHAKRHEGSSKYACDFCEKTFTEKGNLRVHMRIHTGEKMHSCKICGKKFSRVFLLSLHLRTHTGDAPYKCKVCMHAFKQKCDLRKHARVHIGTKRYHCTCCGQGFMHQTKLKRHMKEHEHQVANISKSSRNHHNYDKLSEIVTELELDNMPIFDDQLPFKSNLNEDYQYTLSELIQE